MTTKVIAAPETTWTIRTDCDTAGCRRHVVMAELATSQAAAVQQAREHAASNEGWTSAPRPMGEGRVRGFNTVDLCPQHSGPDGSVS